MNDLQKKEICKIINIETEKLGSRSKVANKCGVSGATITQMLGNKWDLIADKMWLKIADSLDWKPTGWQIAETTNTRLLHNVFTDAREQSLFFAVSHKAGSGKTASARAFVNQYTDQPIHWLQCQEWGAKDFLSALCKMVGVEPKKGYVKAVELIELVTDFFKQRSHLLPLLIIDEADKLKPAALRTLIPIYNRLEDEIGLVVMGTENLQKEIKRGVRYNRKGFDEIDSRFGRQFIHLYGASYKDVKSICQINGIKDAKKQRTIWDECNPVQINVSGQFVQMIEDIRRLKRIIQRENLATKTNLFLN